MTSRDTERQPHPADPVLDDDVVLGVVRAWVPDAQMVSALDETGGEARVYVVDDEIVLKTQRPHRVRGRTSLTKEAFLLNHLAAADPTLPVPRPLGNGEHQGIEYLVMTRMPGNALARTELAPAARDAALRAAGAAVRRVHAVDQEPLSASGLFPGDSAPADLPGRIGESLGRLLPNLAEKDGWPAELAPERVLQLAVAAAPTDTAPVVLHSNPGPEHVFVDPGTGRFVGLIDFGDAYRSHPAFDPRTWVSRPDSDQLLAGYVEAGPVGPGFMVAWHLGLLIQEATFAAYGWQEPGPAAANIARILDQLD